MSLHSFCIHALLLSSRTLQVGHSMDGLFCNTWLRSTCGSKVHRVPFISPLLVLLGQQRLVSQLLSLINTPVDKSERMNEKLPNPAWILFFRHLCNTEALWGSWLSLEVPLWVPARQVWGASLHGIRKQRVDATCLIYLKKISLLCLWGEIKFPRADAAAPLPNNNLICSLESKETALVSTLTGLIYLVYMLYKRTHLLQAT